MLLIKHGFSSHPSEWGILKASKRNDVKQVMTTITKIERNRYMCRYIYIYIFRERCPDQDTDRYKIDVVCVRTIFKRKKKSL